MIKEIIAKNIRLTKLKEVAKYQFSIFNDKDLMNALNRLNDNF